MIPSPLANKEGGQDEEDLTLLESAALSGFYIPAATAARPQSLSQPVGASVCLP